ncbi:MAG TPA: adenosine deaminase, partial [Gemmatimonadaceae bacterium]|nr:adenosine deaminase [Gemmatimonadaceae bacterium]
KAELHCHLDGSLRPSTLAELAREQGVRLPDSDPEAVRAYMRVDNAHNLEEYLERFEVTLSVLQTSEALERAAYELAEDAARDGVLYLEVRYAPLLNVRNGLTLGEAIEAPLRGLARAERAHGIVARTIVCALRTLPPDVSMQMARLASEHRTHGVVGFDLAGPERGHPAADHEGAFQHAIAHGLACTCHAGEGWGPDSVRQAVHTCGARRIGHGTRLIEDAALMQDVAQRGVALEICLTSNLQTHAAESYDVHPLRTYFDNGLAVVLNTDNRLMSDVNLVDEYRHAAEHLGFTASELCRVALTGFEHAFVAPNEKQMLLDRAHRAIADLGVAVA